MPRHLGLIAAVVVALACPRPARAADVVNVLSGYNLTSWGPIKDGLPLAPVLAIAQDAEGYLWLGTSAGLVRFDGVRLVPFEARGAVRLPDAPVRALHVAKDGSLWVGLGEAGVSRIDHEVVTNYGGEADRPTVVALAEGPDGTIWGGGRRGLFSFRSDGWQRWSTERGLPDAAVQSVAVGPDGGLLVGTSVGVFGLGQAALRFASVFAPTAPSASSNRDSLGIWGEGIRGLAQDGRGRLWMTDPVAGFRTLGKGQDRHHAPEKARGSRLLYDRRGDLWVGTWGQGLWRVRDDPSSGVSIVEHATALTGLLGNGVHALYEDREGIIWVGTLDGLNRLTPHRARSLTDIGLVGAVDVTPDGSVWIGTDDELLQWVDGAIRPRHELRSLTHRPLSAVHAAQDGSLWVATDRELFSLIKGRLTPVPLTIADPPTQIDLLTSSRDGTLWIYDLRQGLLRRKDGQLSRFRLPSDAGARRLLALFGDRSGRVWVSFSDGDVWVIEADGTSRAYGLSDGLRPDHYRTFHEDADGAIWLGGLNGISRFQDDSFSSLASGQAFPARSIRSIARDDAGRLWLGTVAGIMAFGAAEFDLAFADPTYLMHHTLYEKSDGLGGTPQWFGHRGAVRSREGELWFVTSRGVTIIDPSTLASGRLSAPARVEGVVANGHPFPLSGDHVLPPRTTRVEIAYTALNLGSALKTRFRYRLDGVDSDWVDAGTRREAFYANLPPGAYRFHVAASGHDGVWSDPETEWTFSIQPLFYQTRWFLGVSVLAGVLLVATAWRLHLRQVRRQFAVLIGERARLGREIHDTLLQSLFGVALQCDSLANDSEAPAPTLRARIRDLRRDVEGYMREARQSIWDLRSLTPGERTLPEVLRKVGEQSVVGTTARFTFSLSGPHRACPPRVEEHLVRIAREAIVNAVRHGRAEHVGVELCYAERVVTLRVSDDGQGFDPTVLSVADGHYGLIGMRERVAEIAGKFEVVSRPGRGTLIEASAPYV